jgi:hypothetical protein
MVGLASSLGAGALLNRVGWRLMNALLVPWLLATMIAVAWLGYQRRAAGRRQGG